MSRILLCCALVVLATLSAGPATAQNLTDAKEMRLCKLCGMSREAFSYSRMLIEYDDGTKVGTCSIHCAVRDLDSNPGKKVKALLVGDYKTKELVDAEKAFWVIGGKKQGVMTIRAKWAFVRKTDADAFIKKNGGKLASFDDAMRAAREDAKAMQGGHGSGGEGHSHSSQGEGKTHAN
jgi:nitrous oxide reductase accessory protein NosL